GLIFGWDPKGRYLAMLLLGPWRYPAKSTSPNGLRRWTTYRPVLELLEERLPPGDGVLSALFARVWMGPGLAPPDFASWAPQRLDTEEPPAERPSSRAGQGVVPAEDSLSSRLSLPLAIFPPEHLHYLAHGGQEANPSGLSHDRRAWEVPS